MYPESLYIFISGDNGILCYVVSSKVHSKKSRIAAVVSVKLQRQRHTKVSRQVKDEREKLSTSKNVYVPFLWLVTPKCHEIYSCFLVYHPKLIWNTGWIQDTEGIKISIYYTYMFATVVRCTSTFLWHARPFIKKKKVTQINLLDACMYIAGLTVACNFFIFLLIWYSLFNLLEPTLVFKIKWFAYRKSTETVFNSSSGFISGLLV